MNVQACEKGDALYILMNGGSKCYVEKVTLTLLPIKAYTNKKSMATILSFKDVSSIPGVRITMDVKSERAIIVHWNVKLIKFTECDDRLYLFDTDATENNIITEDYRNNATTQFFNTYYMITTITNNKEFYTQQEI